MSEICQFLDWDSRFFDLRIARLLEQHLDDPALQAALDWCKLNQIDCLYFLADSADQTSVRLAEDAGFNLVDIRMTLSRSLEGYAPLGLSPGGVLVRSWQPADLPTLQAIAATGFSATRFYFDPGFTRQAVDALYQTWITKSCFGYAQEVLVAVPSSPPDAAPYGFITAHVEQEDSHESGTRERYGSIGLLGIDPNVRRQGVGNHLVDSCLSWFAAQGITQLNVVTQGRNIAAQRLYQRHGFLTQTVQLWYHLWFR